MTTTTKARRPTPTQVQVCWAVAVLTASYGAADLHAIATTTGMYRREARSVVWGLLFAGVLRPAAGFREAFLPVVTST